MATFNDHFEETVVNTPKPQACSTSSKRNVNLTESSVEYPSYLQDSLDVVNRLKEELAKTSLGTISTSNDSFTSSARSSSLGILDDSDLKDFSVYGSTTKLLEAMQSGDTKENFQRDLVRERALQALNSTVPSLPTVPSEMKEPRRSCINLTSPGPLTSKMENKGILTNLTFNKETQEDVSGFSVLATSSQLDRDEEYCQEKWGDLPLEPRDVSFRSGISVGDTSLDFMPEDDSFLRGLGSSNPPPYERSDIEDSRLSNVSVPSLSAIAEALRGMPTDASSSLLVDALLKTGSSARTSIATKSSAPSKRSSFNQSSLVSSTSGLQNVASDDSGPEKPYRVTAVQGSATQVVFNTENHCELLTKKDDNEIILKLVRESPTQMRLLLLPFVTGKMKIVVAETGPKSLKHVVYLFTEEPNVEVLSSCRLDIGNLPEGCMEKSVALLKNNNSAMICLNHVLNEEVPASERRFHVESSKEMVIPPNGVLGADIFFHGVLDGSRSQETVRGDVEFFMNVPLDSSFPKITVAKLYLKMNVFKPRIQVGKSCLGQVYPPGEKKSVEIINLSPCPLQLSATVDPHGLFGVSPSQLTLQPRNPCTFSVIRKNDANNTVVGNLCLQVNPRGPVYTVKLVGVAGKDADLYKYAFPIPESVSSSPGRSTSPSSVGAVEGPLLLESTQGVLVWSSVDLNTSSEVTCCLRNKSSNREKLIFNLRDPTGAFYILKDGEKRKEMRLSLDPMQKKEITAVCLPSTTGQLKASIDITRVYHDGEKKVLGLHAFGGRGKLIVEGLSVDLDTERKTMLLNGDSLSSTFFLQNVGSGVSYFSITQPCIEGTCMEITPRCGLLDPGTREVISLYYQSSATQIEYLLRTNKKSTIKVTNIVITYGDEPSRLRLHRLLRNYGKKSNDLKLAPIFKNLAEMEMAFPIKQGSTSIVSTLKDPVSSLCTLYREGVLEWNVDVVVNRTALEAAQLDSTQMFTPLDTTIRANETMAHGMSTTYCDISSFGPYKNHN